MKTKKAILSAALCLTLVAANAGPMFGEYDFKQISMTDGDCMYIRHYYQTRFFWIVVGSGYWDEQISGTCTN